MIASLTPLVLAGTVADRDLREAIAGDLLEEHAECRAAHGSGRANWWLLVQLVHSFPHFAALSAGGACGFTPRYIRRFYAGLALVVGIGITLSLGITWSHEAFARTASVAVPFLGGLLATVAGAYVASVLVTSAPLVAALGVGVVATFAGVGALLLGDVTAFRTEWVALQVLLPFAAFAGGLARARQLR